MASTGSGREFALWPLSTAANFHPNIPLEASSSPPLPPVSQQHINRTLKQTPRSTEMQFFRTPFQDLMIMTSLI